MPEIADLIAKRAPGTLLCAAGGIADGRGLAAALMLGADGVVVGTRFWACEESLVLRACSSWPPWPRVAMIRCASTYWTSCANAPGRHATRAAFCATTLCANGLGARTSSKADAFEAERYQAAAKAADPGIAATIVGEAVGLIRSIEPAGVILERMVAEAEQLLARGPIITGAGAHDLQVRDRACRGLERRLLAPGRGFARLA